MVLLYSCCCWSDLKVASVASAMFSLVTSLVEVILMVALFSGEYQMSGREIFRSAQRVFYLLFLLLAVLNVIMVLLASILLASFELDTRGTRMMLPWLMGTPVQMSYEAVVCSYFFFSALLARNTNQPIVTNVFSYLLAAIAYWVVKFFLNIFAHMTVLSYYQQLNKLNNYKVLKDNKRFLRTVYKQVPGSIPGRATSVDQHSPLRLPLLDDQSHWRSRAPPLYSTPRGNPSKSCVKKGLPEDSVDWSHPWGVTTISDASIQQDTRKLDSLWTWKPRDSSRNCDSYGITNAGGCGDEDWRNLDGCEGGDGKSTRLCRTLPVEGPRRLPRTRLTGGQRRVIESRTPASGAQYASVFKYGYPTVYNGRQFSNRSSVN